MVKVPGPSYWIWRRTMMSNNPEIAKKLREQGFNIVPVKQESKVIDGTSDEVNKWKKDGCKKKILPNQNIAFQHGPYSQTWAVDLDDKTLLDDLMQEEKTRDKNVIVITPKQGHHLIFKTVPGDEPPGDTKFMDGIIDKKITDQKNDGNDYTKDGKKIRKIDLKYKGYTICPESIHPDTKTQYRFLNDCSDPQELKFSDFAQTLSQFGFEKSTYCKSIKDAIQHKIGYDYGELIHGCYGIGWRRRKQRSLYIQKRMFGSTEEQAFAAITKINKTCLPPLDEKEVKINCDSAERFFINTVKPEMDTKNGQKMIEKMKKKAEILDTALEMAERFKIISTVSKEMWFYKQTDGLYHKHGEELIRIEIKDDIDVKDRDTVVSEIRDRTMIRPDEVDNETGQIFNQVYDKIVVKNGVVDLNTGLSSEFDSSLRCITRINAEYDSTATCPNFDRLLETSCDGNQRKIIWILELFALCLIKKNIVQRGFVLTGNGQNGKSTILGILVKLLGITNVSTQALSTFEDNKNLGFDLFGKSANILADGGTESIEKTGKLKAILGGDAIRHEEKYRNAFSYVPHAVMIQGYNELPPVNDKSDGFNRKIQVIVFTKSFYGDAEDASLAKIKDDPKEMSGILNKLLPICKRILETEKLEDPHTRDDTKKIWTYADDSTFLYLTDRLAKSVDNSIPRDEMYDKYTKYCNEIGLTAESKNVFTKKILEWLGSKLTHTRIDGKNAAVFKGVEWKIGKTEQVTLDDDE